MKWIIPKLETMSDVSLAVCGSGSSAGGDLGLEVSGTICQNGPSGLHNGEGCLGGSGDIGTGWDVYCHTGTVDSGCITGTWDGQDAKCLAGSGVLLG